MPEARDTYVNVPGARLYVRELGAGYPLVVLHGGPDFNHRYLLPELDRLARAGRAIYYDQRGRGKSSAGVAAEDMTLASEIDDLDRLRHALGLEAVAVLGHSWGAVLAMEYAARHADRVSHLVLMNVAPASHADLELFRAGRAATEAARVARLREIAATPEYLAGRLDAEADYYRVHFGATLRREDSLEEIVGRLRTDFTPEDVIKARAIEDRLYDQTWRQPGYDLPARLRTLDVPTLVIHGERDLVPLACATHVAEAIPGSRLVVLDGCGHFAYLERTADTLAAIAGFLAC